MHLATLIAELIKLRFTNPQTIHAGDVDVTTLTRQHDQARAKILSFESASVYSLSLFPEQTLDIPIVIRNNPFPAHAEIDAILKTFAERIRTARRSHTHLYHAPENCTHFGDNTSCRMICDGGLALCALCGHLEASLTTDCPGTNTYATYGDLVYAGAIDFRAGHWVEGACSPHTPAIRQTLNVTKK